VAAPPAEVFHERERLAIDKEVMRLHSRWNISVTGVECQGYTPEEIERLCNQHEMSLVVMGMRHHNFCSRLLGSVATSSIHHAGYPVLLVPDTIQFSSPAKILFAADADFSTYAHSLDPLKLFVRTLNTTLDVVQVLTTDEIWNLSESDGVMNLEIQLHTIPHEWIIAQDGSVTRGILRSSDRQHADWIAVAPRHFIWLESLFTRSISGNLAFATNKPLLILPAEERVLTQYHKRHH
jgi:hypothetical protein